tara:strand:+ start:486 stop:617 length:132 start_codon:yes stop_codon:yes gene_type:complete
MECNGINLERVIMLKNRKRCRKMFGESRGIEKYKGIYIYYGSN